jgi:hypothetical protein
MRNKPDPNKLQNKLQKGSYGVLTIIPKLYPGDRGKTWHVHESIGTLL